MYGRRRRGRSFRGRGRGGYSSAYGSRRGRSSGRRRRRSYYTGGDRF